MAWLLWLTWQSLKVSNIYDQILWRTLHYTGLGYLSLLLICFFQYTRLLSWLQPRIFGGIHLWGIINKSSATLSTRSMGWLCSSKLSFCYIDSLVYGGLC